MPDPRIARIERGVELWQGLYAGLYEPMATAALADLSAWQEIAERHHADTIEGDWCDYCYQARFPCPDRQAADAAIDRLDDLWGTDAPTLAEDSNPNKETR